MDIGVSITKKVFFRGVNQEFSNVYHYRNPSAVTGPWGTIVSEIVTTEKALHSTDVTFVTARVWSVGGSPAQNEMLHEETLTGTGTQATNSSMDRERAVLIRWPAGKDIRGKPVYLRKWYHCCGNANAVIFAAAQLQQTAAIAAGDRTTIASKADENRQVLPTASWDIISKKGRLTTGAAQCHSYLEHHQLGEAWR